MTSKSVMVPVEPTLEQIDAGDDPQFGNGPDIVRHIYQRMIAATPTSIPEEYQGLAEIEALVSEYWDLAYVEGEAGRTTDTPDGDAQRVRSAISAALTHLSTQLEQVKGERDNLADELASPTWPKWAASITDQLKSYGVDIDPFEGWDLPVDLDDWLSEAVRIETEKLRARAEAAERSLAEAREALRPFAQKMEWPLSERDAGRQVFCKLTGKGSGASFGLEADDFIRARSVLTPTPEGEDGK